MGDKHPFRFVVLLAAVIALLAMFSEIFLITLALGYLVSGVIARLAYSWSRGRERGQGLPPV